MKESRVLEIRLRAEAQIAYAKSNQARWDDQPGASDSWFDCGVALDTMADELAQGEDSGPSKPVVE